MVGVDFFSVGMKISFSSVAPWWFLTRNPFVLCSPVRSRSHFPVKRIDIREEEEGNILRPCPTEGNFVESNSRQDSIDRERRRGEGVGSYSSSISQEVGNQTHTQLINNYLLTSNRPLLVF